VETISNENDAMKLLYQFKPFAPQTAVILLDNMNAGSLKTCDNKSVGVIIRDLNGKFALLKRARFPVGIAPVAGHIDDHGTPSQAAIAETREEIGIIIDEDDLRKTSIQNKLINNICRRRGGDHHYWWIYEVNDSEGEIYPDPDETKGAKWYTSEELHDLAGRTREYLSGKIDKEDWEANPGLEEIWLTFLSEMGYLE
jgi:8-oxo-dGTP pyrophosphatase MutT (NUDIX family)